MSVLKAIQRQVLKAWCAEEQHHEYLCVRIVIHICTVYCIKSLSSQQAFNPQWPTKISVCGKTWSDLQPFRNGLTHILDRCFTCFFPSTDWDALQPASVGNLGSFGVSTADSRARVTKPGWIRVPASVCEVHRSPFLDTHHHCSSSDFFTPFIEVSCLLQKINALLELAGALSSSFWSDWYCPSSRAFRPLWKIPFNVSAISQQQV